MATLNIGQLEPGSLVLYFDTEGTHINAYTFASAVVAVADAAKAANAALNPGYDLEVVIEAIGPGSFRAKLRTIAKSAKNLFSAKNFRDLALGVLAGYITLKVWPSDTKVTINTNEVVIQNGADRLIVPRNVYEGIKAVEKAPQFRTATNRVLTSITLDPDVRGLSFVPALDSPRPEVILSRDLIEAAAVQESPEPDERTVIEQCDLDIVKAILEKGRRKWEFIWRGVRISAPVLDEAFFGAFQAHNITIAPGDQLRVRLAIRQKRDSATGLFTNSEYEVIEVLGHVPRVRQLPLSANTDHPRDASEERE